jgi:hypothetical protein
MMTSIVPLRKNLDVLIDDAGTVKLIHGERPSILLGKRAAEKLKCFIKNKSKVEQPATIIDIYHDVRYGLNEDQEMWFLPHVKEAYESIVPSIVLLGHAFLAKNLQLGHATSFHAKPEKPAGH